MKTPRSIKSTPSQKLLREFLNYNAKTGVLTWRTRKRKYFKNDRSCKIWNTKFASKSALIGRTSRFYMFGSILGTYYYTHRIIWKWMTGQEPGIIDHRNGNPLDNRWANLRSGTQQQNCRNCRVARNNTSSVTGVSWDKSRNKWAAHIMVNRKNIHLGRFTDIEKAVQARKAAERKYGFPSMEGRA